MKNTLAAAALVLAALGFGHLASGQQTTPAAHTSVTASTAQPNDLGWGTGTTPVNG